MKCAQVGLGERAGDNRAQEEHSVQVPNLGGLLQTKVIVAFLRQRQRLLTHGTVGGAIRVQCQSRHAPDCAPSSACTYQPR